MKLELNLNCINYIILYKLSTALYSVYIYIFILFFYFFYTNNKIYQYFFFYSFFFLNKNYNLTNNLVLINFYNFNLINNLFFIHPLLVYFIIFILLKNFIVKTNIKTNIKNKHGILPMLIASSVLYFGALWSWQELNWGGFWNWDVVEMENFFYFTITIFLYHTLKTKNFFFYFFSIFFLFFATRTGFNNSIHSFTLNETIFFYFFFFLLLMMYLYLLRKKDVKYSIFTYNFCIFLLILFVSSVNVFNTTGLNFNNLFKDYVLIFFFLLLIFVFRKTKIKHFIFLYTAVYCFWYYNSIVVFGTYNSAFLSFNSLVCNKYECEKYFLVITYYDYINNFFYNITHKLNNFFFFFHIIFKSKNILNYYLEFENFQYFNKFFYFNVYFIFLFFYFFIIFFYFFIFIAFLFLV